MKVLQAGAGLVERTQGLHETQVRLVVPVDAYSKLRGRGPDDASRQLDLLPFMCLEADPDAVAPLWLEGAPDTDAVRGQIRQLGVAAHVPRLKENGDGTGHPRIAPLGVGALRPGVSHAGQIGSDRPQLDAFNTSLCSAAVKIPVIRRGPRQAPFLDGYDGAALEGRTALGPADPTYAPLCFADNS